eukprot:2165412-Prymnesium_polylepis.1
MRASVLPRFRSAPSSERCVVGWVPCTVHDCDAQPPLPGGWKRERGVSGPALSGLGAAPRTGPIHATNEPCSPGHYSYSRFRSTAASTHQHGSEGHTLTAGGGTRCVSS